MTSVPLHHDIIVHFDGQRQTWEEDRRMINANRMTTKDRGPPPAAFDHFEGHFQLLCSPTSSPLLTLDPVKVGLMAIFAKFASLLIIMASYARNEISTMPWMTQPLLFMRLWSQHEFWQQSFWKAPKRVTHVRNVLPGAADVTKGRRHTITKIHCVPSLEIKQ